jgi:hypothetical protein
MIPEIAMFWVNFNGIGTQELPSRREDQQKSVNTDFQFYESRQKPVQFGNIFSRNFASRLYCKIALLWFSKMDHCYVVCVVLRCKFSQLD